MKKLLSGFLAAVMTVSALFAVTAAAATNYLTFELDEWGGKSYVVTECDQAAKGTVAIPANYNGKPVTAIGSYAFYGCFDVTAVTVPNSVTVIENYAFIGCSGLASITLPDSVRVIGQDAFSDTAYYNNTANRKNGVLYIGNHLINADPAVVSGAYTVKDGTKCIADNAFFNCKNLTAVTVPDCEACIGNNAFLNCTKLNSITIPDSIALIGSDAFYNTAYYNNSANWEKGVLYIGNCLIQATEDVGTAYTVKGGTKSIASGAFCEIYDLSSVVIPNSVTNIGCSAFEFTLLKSVTLGNGLKYVGDRAFFDCDSLKTVTIPASVTEIGNGAFGYYGDSATGEHFPESGYTIKCSSGSAAYKYAEENGFKIVLLPNAPAAAKLAKIANTAKGVTITWNAVSGADSYTIYRKAGSAATWAKLASLTGGSQKSYTDTKVTSGTKYTYTVRPQNAGGAGGYDETGLSVVYLAQPTVTLANINGAVNIKWSKVPGATGYIVYRKAGAATSWTKLAAVTGNATVAYNDKNVTSGGAYTYTVKACKGTSSSSYCAGVAIRYLAQPTVTVANANGSVTVKWSKVAGAKGYYIYRKAGSAASWSKLATISSGTTVAYADKKVTSGTAYQYTVRAINSKYASSYCTGAAIKYIAPGKLISAASAKAGITVKWNKIAAASGYVVYRKVGSGSWAKLATVKGSATVSYLDKSAVKGTTYTYCVRPFNGSFAGSYANTLNCKDKY